MRLYIVVREDLPQGLQASVALHVAQSFQAAHTETTRAWMQSSNRVVIVGVPDADALDRLLAEAKEKGLCAEGFFDEDLHPSLSAVAIEPGNKSRTLCRGLPLAFQ